MTPDNNHNPRLPGKPTEPSGSFNVYTVLFALRYWWKITTPIGILLGAGAGLAVYCLITPTYTASTWLSIRERPEHLLVALNNENPVKWVNNQLELIKSPTVLEPVISLPAVASTPELATQRDPVPALRKQLKLRAVGQSDFFVIEYTSVAAQKAALVVNEVARAYLEQQRKHESGRQSRTIDLLKKRLSEQQATVKLLRENVQSLSMQRTGKNPFAVQGKEEVLKVRDPFAELKAQLVTAEVDHELMVAQAQAETEFLEQQAITVPQGEIDRYLDANQQVIGLRARLAQNRGKLLDHERNSTSLERNVAYQHLQKQLADDEAALEKLLGELRVQAREDLESQIRTARADQLAATNRKLASSALTRKILQEKVAGELKNQKEFTGDTLELEFKRADYDRAADVADAVSAKIVAMEFEQRALERVEIVHEATVPLMPDEAFPIKNILMAVFAGLFFPFGIVIAIEYLYRRVSSRNQLETTGKMSVVGEVTTLPAHRRSRRDKAGLSNPELQLFEESIDGLRTYLSLKDSLAGLKVLAVTSAISGEGKTSLASQLAVSVASATGERTLLIDGDMRSPDVHRIFELDCGPGLAEVLKGESTLEEAIDTEFSDTVHLLTAGYLSSSPHRLLGNGAFVTLLDKLRETYPYIIIDTPPILPASESLVMARSADAAVLCVRRDYSRMHQVAEAYSRLQTAGVRTAGAVLNGIPLRDYAYRYGSYYYNRPPRGASPAETSKA